jgi:hypothetical protein
MSQEIFFRSNFDDTPFQMDHGLKRSTLSNVSAVVDWNLKEWIFITSLSKALSLALDCETFTKTDHITPEVV